MTKYERVFVDFAPRVQCVVLDEYFEQRASDASWQAFLVERLYGPLAAECVGNFLQAMRLG